MELEPLPGATYERRKEIEYESITGVNNADYESAGFTAEDFAQMDGESLYHGSERKPAAV